jgi:hypothetical protein
MRQFLTAWLRCSNKRSSPLARHRFQTQNVSRLIRSADPNPKP